MFLKCSPELPWRKTWKGFALLVRLIFPAIETNNNNPTEECQGFCLLGRMLHLGCAFLPAGTTSLMRFLDKCWPMLPPLVPLLFCTRASTYCHPQLCNINLLKHHPAYLNCKQLPAYQSTENPEQNMALHGTNVPEEQTTTRAHCQTIDPLPGPHLQPIPHHFRQLFVKSLSLNFSVLHTF